MTDMVSLLEARGGTRHYREDPDPSDRHRREHRRRWPWNEMHVNDFVLVEWDEPDAERTFMVAKSAASQYGSKRGQKFASWSHASGGLIYRER